MSAIYVTHPQHVAVGFATKRDGSRDRRNKRQSIYVTHHLIQTLAGIGDVWIVRAKATRSGIRMWFIPQEEWPLCPECGIAYTPRNKKQRTCSRNCTRRLRYAARHDAREDMRVPA